jgi:peroxiredoxin
MKLINGITMMVVMVASGLLFTADIKATPALGSKAPMFYLKTLRDEYFDLKEHCGNNEAVSEKDKSNVILIFFNTACIPCIRLIYETKIIYQDYKDKGFKVFLISIDKEKAASLSLFKYRHKVDFPIVIDKFNIVAKIYGAEQVIPTVYLLDKKGMVRYTNFGFNVDVKDQLQAEMKKLVKTDTKDN